MHANYWLLEALALLIPREALGLLCQGRSSGERYFQKSAWFFDPDLYALVPMYPLYTRKAAELSCRAPLDPTTRKLESAD